MNMRLAAVLVLAVGASVLGVVVATRGSADEARPYRAYITSAARDGAFEPGPTTAPGGLPALPAGWPAKLPLGQSDAPGGAAATATRGLALRYQYLAGGVNTGNGWANWNPAGSFVSNYIAESRAAAVVPVFSYYMVRQSAPGATMGEVEGVRANLANPQTMRAVFEDLDLFFQRAHAAGGLVVLHFEPDLWGFIQQAAGGDDAGRFAVAVAKSGHPAAAGLPDTAAGLAQALLRLRDLRAPNVLVAYHLSPWGTGIDPVHSDPDDDELQALAARSASFYASLGAAFDLAFNDLSDRDAAFKQYIYGDGGASWWDEGDFARHAFYLRSFVTATRLRVVLWQIPEGNTKMRSVNNTWNHFQDNKVEWFLGDEGFLRLRAHVEAGVIGLLFGRGADGATCACDAAGDGVTNPAPINGNTGVATSADDDGGYFAERAGVYARSGGMALP